MLRDRLCFECIQWSFYLWKTTESWKKWLSVGPKIFALMKIWLWIAIKKLKPLFLLSSRMVNVLLRVIIMILHIRDLIERKKTWCLLRLVFLSYVIETFTTEHILFGRLLVISVTNSNIAVYKFYFGARITYTLPLIKTVVFSRWGRQPFEVSSFRIEIVVFKDWYLVKTTNYCKDRKRTVIFLHWKWTKLNVFSSVR